jgi:hypothetical protein
MVEPYGAIIKSTAILFRNLGFSECEDSEFAITLTNGQCRLEFSTEKYYHPSLISVFYDKNGMKYPIRSLMIIYDALQYENDLKILNSIELAYHLNEDNNPDQKNGIFAYIEASVSQTFYFISNHINELTEPSSSVKAKCKNIEIEVLKKFGL